MKIKNTFNDMSIKFKLIIYYTFVVLMAIIIFTSFVLVQSSNVVAELAQRNAEESINSAQEHILSLIDSINVSLLSFQVKENVQDILSSPPDDNPIEDVNILEKELLSIDPFQTNISSLKLYSLTRDDFPELNNYQSVFSDKQMKNDRLFNKMLESGSATSWFVSDSLSESDSFIIASKLITDVRTKKPTALLQAKIKISTFTDIVDKITLAETGKIFLCTQSHLVNPSNTKLGRDLTNNPALFNGMLKKEGRQYDYIYLDGHKYYVCTNPIPDTRLYLIGAVKISEFNSAQKSLTLAILMTAVFLLIFSILFIMYVSSLITKPLSVLTKKMSGLNYSTHNTITPQSNDEIGILFNTFNAMQNKIADLIESVNREIKIRRIAELKALQAQITPHFLYNTLNSICALSQKHKAYDIEEMTIALSKFFMNSLNNGGEMLTLKKEVEHVLSYIYIQKIRYKDKFDVNINLPSELENYSICKLTLQPLVENCINHAFYGINYKGEINIDFKKESENIIITVADNGLGELICDPDQLNEYINQKIDINEPIEKYGVHNVNQRIHLYFGDEYGLNYTSQEDGGFVVTIKIAAINHREDLK